jgi:hypothetical protein
LRDGGYARGVVARLNGKGLVFGYFFGPKLNSPDEASFRGLNPHQAVNVGKFGDLSLINREWIQLGQIENWNADEWPMPPLIRVNEITGRAFLSRYDDHTFRCVDEEEVSPTVVDEYPYDRTMGAGAIEIRLTKLLNR